MTTPETNAIPSPTHPTSAVEPIDLTGPTPPPSPKPPTSSSSRSLSSGIRSTPVPKCEAGSPKLVCVKPLRSIQKPIPKTRTATIQTTREPTPQIIDVDAPRPLLTQLLESSTPFANERERVTRLARAKPIRPVNPVSARLEAYRIRARDSARFPFKCEDCLKTFGQIIEHDRHLISRKHLNKIRADIWWCELCHKKFDNSHDYEKHVAGGKHYVKLGENFNIHYTK